MKITMSMLKKVAEGSNRDQRKLMRKYDKLIKREKCGAVCNNNGCNCKHPDGCCGTVIITIPKRKLCPACRQRKLYYRNGLPISKYCSFCKKQKELEEKAKHLTTNKKKIDLTAWHEEGRILTENHCEICGYDFPDNMLTGHHVFSQKAYPQWRLNPKNRLIVCQECHNKIHNGEIKINKENYRPAN